MHLRNDLRELIRASGEGYECMAAFVIQMEGVTEIRPNVETHPQFGQVLEEAEEAGVRILCLQCSVGEDTLEIIAAKEQ